MLLVIIMANCRNILQKRKTNQEEFRIEKVIKRKSYQSCQMERL